MANGKTAKKIEHPVIVIGGTTVTEKGTSTIQFPAANLRSYLMLSGDDLYVVYVKNASSATAVKMKDGTSTQVVSNGEYNFTIGPGLAWYQNPKLIASS